MNIYKVKLFPWRDQSIEKMVRADYFEVTHSGALLFYSHDKQKAVQSFSQWGSVQLWDSAERTAKVFDPPYWSRIKQT